MPATGYFITATGTGVGKTFVTRGLARALIRRGHPVAALKPVETGCDPDPSDAVALGKACGRPHLAHLPGLYRARSPLAPYAATLAGEPPPPDAATLARRCRSFAADHELLLVEGAGGLLVPLSEYEDFSHFAAILALPLLFVAPDALGVLSHLLTACEAAHRRGLTVAACILVDPDSSSRDHASESNARILAERLQLPVCSFPRTADDDQTLADAFERTGLIDQLGLNRTPTSP